jgi:hypothetical protein
MSSISWPSGKLTWCEGRYWNGTDFSWKQNGVGERWHSIDIPGSSSSLENLNYVYNKTRAVAVFRSVLSLSSGERCTAVKYEVYVHPSNGSALSHTLHCHLYTSDPTYASANVDYIPTGNGYPSGYIGSASVQHTFSSADEYKKLTFNFSGLNLNADTSLYFYFTHEPVNGAAYGEHVLTYGKYGTKYPVATGTFKPALTLSVSPTSVSTGNNVSISVGNGSGSSITARIKYGSTQLWSGTSTTGSFSVAVNKSWFTTAGVATAKNMAVTVTIDQDTSLSASFTVTAGSNMNPTVGALSFAPVNSGRVATYFPNSYIAGYTKVKVSAAVTSGSNAAISSVVLSFPGGTNVTMSYNSTSQKYEGTTAAVINGNTTFTVTAKDGRTLSGSKQGTLSGVVAYVKPSVSPTAANCYRCNSGGTKQDGGSYVSAKATATWYSSLSGNALTSFLFYVKEDRTAGYSDSRNLTSGQQSQALQMHVPGANDYVTLVFSIQDKVSDAVTLELRLPAAPKNIYVRRSSTGTYVGVGMAPQRTSGESDIELPDGGAVLVGGFLLQSLSHFNDPSYSGDSFGHDFLAVNISNLYDAKNTTAKFYKAANASGWSNCPVATNVAFYGIREVIVWNEYYCLVRLTELKPTVGRVWTNLATVTGNGISWSGWKSITPV